jgi:hypothetical protein
MTKTVLKTLAGAAAALFLLSVHASAASSDRVRAEAYFNAISGGNAETITAFYADNAEFHWIGGPLQGVYTGKAEIKGVWERFSKAAGDINYKVLELAESKKGKRSTVTARVNFIGPKEVPVRFIMVYENGKIVNEIWEVDKPVVGYASAAPKPDAAPQTPAVAEPVQREAAAPQAAGRNAPEEDRVNTVATVQQGPGAEEPPIQVNAATTTDAVDAKTATAPGTPTPLPPSSVTAPQKKAVAKSPPKKRYAEKKKSQEYSQRDDDGDDGYDGYADPDDVYYGRPRRFYGGYGGFYGRHNWYGRYGGY